MFVLTFIIIFYIISTDLKIVKNKKYKSNGMVKSLDYTIRECFSLKKSMDILKIKLDS